MECTSQMVSNKYKLAKKRQSYEKGVGSCQREVNGGQLTTNNAQLKYVLLRILNTYKFHFKVFLNLLNTNKFLSKPKSKLVSPYMNLI